MVVSESIFHSYHLSPISKGYLSYLILYRIFHELMLTYSPEAGADYLKGTNFYLSTFVKCCKFQRVHIKMNVLSLSQGQIWPFFQSRAHNPTKVCQTISEFKIFSDFVIVLIICMDHEDLIKMQELCLSQSSSHNNKQNVAKIIHDICIELQAITGMHVVQLNSFFSQNYFIFFQIM